jgi:hypothetical protein
LNWLYITIAEGTPVVWSSKSQTEIALSTFEAKYCTIIGDASITTYEITLAESLNIEHDEVTKVCAVGEVNNAALKLANDTNLQKADIFPKGIVKKEFEDKREP